MNPGKKRRKARKKMSPGRRASSRLRSVWKRRTRRGGRYEAYGAVVRTTKSGSPRRGRRKHVKGKGHAWTGRKGTVALYSRKTGKLWGTNPRRRGKRVRRNPGKSLRERHSRFQDVQAILKTENIDDAVSLCEALKRRYGYEMQTGVAYRLMTKALKQSNPRRGKKSRRYATFGRTAAGYRNHEGRHGRMDYTTARFRRVIRGRR